MKICNAQRKSLTSVLMIATIAFGNTSFAESFPFRVAFENLPGVEQIEAGNMRAGIELLEQQLEKATAGSRGDVLATLCGAYVMGHYLDKAVSTCDDAVQTKATDTAHNNRGVYRIFTGNFDGATADFNRARPHRMEEYFEYLKTKHAALIANTNYDILQVMAAEYESTDVNTSVAMQPATTEDVLN